MSATDSLSANPANPSKGKYTGEGIVFPPKDEAEINRRFLAYNEELCPSGVLGICLVLRTATLAVRRERCVDHENATIAQRVRQALAEFVPPEGASEAEVANLRTEVSQRAGFDPSDSATMARKYEAATERSFYRTLKELRQLAKEKLAEDPEWKERLFRQELGSILQMNPEALSPIVQARLMAEDAIAKMPRQDRPVSKPAPRPVPSSDLDWLDDRFEVPFTIGKRR